MTDYQLLVRLIAQLNAGCRVFEIGAGHERSPFEGDQRVSDLPINGGDRTDERRSAGGTGASAATDRNLDVMYGLSRNRCQANTNHGKCREK